MTLGATIATWFSQTESEVLPVSCVLPTHLASGLTVKISGIPAVFATHKNLAIIWLAVYSAKNGRINVTLYSRILRKDLDRGSIR